LQNVHLNEDPSKLEGLEAILRRAIEESQTALAAERSDRTEAEAQLKAAEARLKSLANSDPSTPPVADAAAGIAAARAEVSRLQDSLRQSSLREAELQTALTQESTLRTRLQQEKLDLEKRLNEATTALKAKPTVDPAATRSLENRLARLEKERDDLQKKLARLSLQARTRLVATRLSYPAVTPRDRALEFRLSRP
jgi:chromosome segregation ATPase